MGGKSLGKKFFLVFLFHGGQFLMPHPPPSELRCYLSKAFPKIGNAWLLLHSWTRELLHPIAHPFAALNQSTLRDLLKESGACPWKLMACEKKEKTVCVLHDFLRSEKPLLSREVIKGLCIDCRRDSWLKYISTSRWP